MISALLMAPPSQSLRSSTQTLQPARESSAAQASALMPLPTRTASKRPEAAPAIVEPYSRPRAAAAAAGASGRARLAAAVIDLRSDTQTRPSAAMLEAMVHAEVGDEQRREDPTVLALEERAAGFLGQEQAVYLPTATMANQIALTLLGDPGGELLVEESAHILISELGGAAVHPACRRAGCPAGAAASTAEQVRAAIRPADPLHRPRAARARAREHPQQRRRRALAARGAARDGAAARELGLALHLDGARVANAAVASGVEAAELGRLFDTVTLCLSKGLGCPLGALLAGSEELMERARVAKHRFGGAHAPGRRRRRRRALRARAQRRPPRRRPRAGTCPRRGLGSRAALPVDLAGVETNFVQLDVAALGLSSAEAIALLAQAGVGLSGTVRPGLLRAVTHLDIDDADIEAAIELGAAALAPLVRA